MSSEADLILENIKRAGGPLDYLQKTFPTLNDLRDLPPLYEKISSTLTANKTRLDQSRVNLDSRHAQLLDEIQKTKYSFYSEQEKLSRIEQEYENHKQTLITISQQSKVSFENNIRKTCFRVCSAIRKKIRNVQSHVQEGNYEPLPALIRDLLACWEEIAAEKSLDSKCADSTKSIREVIRGRVDQCLKMAKNDVLRSLQQALENSGWPLSCPNASSNSEILLLFNVLLRMQFEMDVLRPDSATATAATKPDRKDSFRLTQLWAVSGLFAAPIARFRFHFTRKSAGDLYQWGGRFIATAIQSSAEFLQSIVQPTLWSTIKHLKNESALNLDTVVSLGSAQESSWVHEFSSWIHAANRKSSVLETFVDTHYRSLCEILKQETENCTSRKKNTSQERLDDLLLKCVQLVVEVDSLIAYVFDELREYGFFDEEIAKKFGHLEYPESPSAILTLLSDNIFFTMYASAQLRMVEDCARQVLSELIFDAGSDASEQMRGQKKQQQEEPSSQQKQEEEDELACSKLCRVPEFCWTFPDHQLRLQFVKLVEMSSLVAVRARLKYAFNTVGGDDDLDVNEAFAQKCRIAAVSNQMILTLTERGEEPEYVELLYDQSDDKSKMEIDEHNFFQAEIDSYKAMIDSICTFLEEQVVEDFENDARAYWNSVRFGDLDTVDSRKLVARDLSRDLEEAGLHLRSYLEIIKRRIPSRKLSARIWRSICKRLDQLMFNESILFFCVGGPSTSAVSASNEYLGEGKVRDLLLQICYDNEMVIEFFDTLTLHASNFFPYTSESIRVIRWILRESKSEIAQERSQICQYFSDLVNGRVDAHPQVENNILKKVLSVKHLTLEELGELFLISGKIQLTTQ